MLKSWYHIQVGFVGLSRNLSLSLQGHLATHAGRGIIISVYLDHLRYQEYFLGVFSDLHVFVRASPKDFHTS